MSFNVIFRNDVTFKSHKKEEGDTSLAPPPVILGLNMKEQEKVETIWCAN